MPLASRMPLRRRGHTGAERTVRLYLHKHSDKISHKSGDFIPGFIIYLQSLNNDCNPEDGTDSGVVNRYAVMAVGIISFCCTFLTLYLFFFLLIQSLLIISQIPVFICSKASIIREIK